MYNFAYHRPRNLQEAGAILSRAPEAKIVAGGMTLLPAMKLRLAAPSDLIDLSELGELRGIRVDGNAVVIGAMTRHADVAHSQEVKRAIPALASLAEVIGDPQVRNRGTIGGSVANADPAADYPAAVVGLDATVATNQRQIRSDDFFRGLFETALQQGEIIREIAFPIPERAGYMKFRNPASRYAMVGVFVAKTRSGVRVAVTGAGPSVFRVQAMEQALNTNFSPDAIKDIGVPANGLNSDIHGSAEYRAHLVGVMARRAVAAAASATR